MKRLSVLTLLYSLTLGVCVSACKDGGAGDQEQQKPKNHVKHVLPPIDVGIQEEEAFQERMRPDYSHPGVFALITGGKRSCLGIRVTEELILTAASCVFDIGTGLVKPGFYPQLAVEMIWTQGEVTHRSSFAVLGAWAHPSFASHFFDDDATGKMSDPEKLTQIMDVALLRFKPIVTNAQMPPIVSIPDTLPDLSSRTLATLQGWCSVQVHSESSATDGGRVLVLQENEKVAGNTRFLADDGYANPRLLSACEGFLGAPVWASPAPDQSDLSGLALIGVTSWVMPGTLRRGVTLLAGAENEEGSFKAWMSSVVGDPPSYEFPSKNARLGCSRSLSSAMGNITVSFEDFLATLEGDRLLVEPVSFDATLRIQAPPAELLSASSAPLVDPKNPVEVSKMFKMVRDVRQPHAMQYLSADSLEIGAEQISLTFSITNRDTVLAIVVVKNETTEGQRTANIFFDNFDPSWCQRKPVEMSSSSP